jgi:uncharacterized membrane protein YdbT with pleckstrin-like domain
MRDFTNSVLAIVGIPVLMALMVAYLVYCVGLFFQFVAEEIMGVEV